MSENNLNYVYTIGGYAALAAAGYAFYQFRTANDRKKVAADTKAARSSYVEPRKENSKKKQRLQSFTSESSAAKNKAPEPEAEKPASYASKAKSKEVDDDVSNREFAKQLAQAQQGKSFAKKADDGRKQKEKSVKQSRADESYVAKDTAAPVIASPPSSNAGADADDDQSPVQSPEVTATDASGVADMLEPAARGPSVLRLTETTEQKPVKKAAKAPEVTETKKQRQNRKKAEAAKEARQEAEKERKVLEEKQRRTARIAEGRAAKDGSQFTAANGNKSAWTEGAPASQGTKAADTNGLHQPLDTFEKPAAAKPAQPTKAQAPAPTEDQQFEKLLDDEEWNTVPSKKSKKSKQDNAASSSDEQPQDKVLQSKPQAQASAPASRPAPAPKTASGNVQNFGSFSALSSKNEPVEEEEEEWDV